MLCLIGNPAQGDILLRPRIAILPRHRIIGILGVRCLSEILRQSAKIFAQIGPEEGTIRKVTPM
jgi:hypothetical protein